MAWRIDADADGHIRTGSIPAGDATYCGFFYQSVDRNTFSTLLSLDDNTAGGGGATEYVYLATDVGGQALQAFWRNTAGASGNSATIITFQVGYWYFVALRRSGTTVTGYARRVGSSQWAKQSTTTSGTIAPTHFRIGTASPLFASENWNGRAAGIRLWNVALNEADILRESFQLAPNRSRRQNLVLWWQENTAVDLSGRGRHPTTKGTATLEPGPPVPLFRNQPAILDYVQAPAGGDIAGTADIAFGAGASMLLGAGQLVGSSDVVFGAGSSTLKGEGQLVGSASILFDTQGVLLGAGALVGSAAITFDASGTLLGTGTLAGSTTIFVDGAATPDQDESPIEGSASLFIDASGTLQGEGNLAGSASIVFGAQATPDGGTPVAPSSGNLTKHVLRRGSLQGNVVRHG